MIIITKKDKMASLLYYCKIDTSEIENSLFDLCSLSKKAVNFHRNIDKKLSLYPELLLRYYICQQKKVSNDSIVFDVTNYGKPYCKTYNDIQFNISHSNDAFVLLLSNSNVGIDLEKIVNFNFDGILKLFTKNEREYILYNKTKDIIDFYKVWTAKEAYTKYLGVQLIRILPRKINYNKIEQFYFEDYIISIYRKNKDPIKMIKITEYDILQMARNIYLF